MAASHDATTFSTAEYAAIQSQSSKKFRRKSPSGLAIHSPHNLPLSEARTSLPEAHEASPQWFQPSVDSFSMGQSYGRTRASGKRQAARPLPKRYATRPLPKRHATRPLLVCELSTTSEAPIRRQHALSDDFAIGQGYKETDDPNGEEASTLPSSMPPNVTLPIRILDQSTSPDDKEKRDQEMIRFQCSAKENEMYQRLATRGIPVSPPDEQDLVERDAQITNDDTTNEINNPTRRLSRKRSSAEMLFAMDSLELCGNYP
uniref:Uncharacterized protein n=1 Tax=Octactis speculum TaxID=3111310 RepID=A0A7S2GRX0_9STRA|mmetsp:Transcript_54337/g.74249  ORF Transcript_54337/g.74249 Transcript_54337/m.74249 type:complete len:260 (+) Transcript_54337:57-836(+)